VGQRLAVGDRLEPAGPVQGLHRLPGPLRPGAAGHEVVPVGGAEPHRGAREERRAVGHQPAGVVHVEVGTDHQVDVLGPGAGRGQAGRQLAAAPAVVPQRPEPGVDQHRLLGAAHQEGADRQVEGAVG
jgi:hypothetical protein